MDTEHKIQPDRITKPIQLLASWLVGLIVIDSAFLIAASKMSDGSWERTALVIAAIANVPVFLLALVLLQTRFRPELQEDSFYAQYLDKRTNELVTVRRDELIEKELVALRADVLAIKEPDELSFDPLDADRAESPLKIGLNHHLAELREAIRAFGFPLNDIFGTAERPAHRVMAIAEYLPYTQRVRILRLAVQMKLDGYAYFHPREEGIAEDVLVGSYGNIQFGILPELATVLEHATEPADLALYERKHRFKQPGRKA